MPLIRNKIVAVYHCNEIQEALTLWHQNPDSSNYINAYILCPKNGKSGYTSIKRKKLRFTETPRELALIKTSYKIRQKPKKGY